VPESPTGPARIGAYPVVGKIGAGGFGTVYLGTDPATGERVAIKVLDWPDHDGRRALFRQEVAALVAVRHPNVVRVRDVIDQPGLAAIVTDYVEGASLRDVVRSSGPLDGPQALTALHGALQGLVAVHAAGLVHADLKPANILLDTTGTSRLIDFGLTGPPRTLAGPQTWIGTPAYLAPEVVLGQHIDARSDLYAAAAMLFELLTGRTPYVDPDPERVAMLQVHSPVPDLLFVRPDAGAMLAALCSQDLAKDPAQRHQNTTAFATSLGHAAREAYGDDAVDAPLAGLVAGTLAVAGGFATGVAVPAALGLLGSAPVTGALFAPGVLAAGAGLAGAGGAAGVGAAGTAGSGGVIAAVGGAKGAAAIAAAVTVVAGGGAAVVIAQQDDDPKPRTDLIRDVDFGNVEWRYHQTTADLTDGRAHVRQTADTAAADVDLVGDMLYLDIDQDGDLDAAGQVRVTYADANAEDHAWYVWLWDQDAGKPVQVRWAVGEGSRCGSSVGDVRVDGDVLLVEQHWRDPSSPGACADTGTISQVKQVAIDDGYPVLRNGVGGWGGYCPQIPAGDALSAKDGTYQPGDAPYGTGPPYTFSFAPDADAASVDASALKFFVPLVAFGNLSGEDGDAGWSDGYELALLGPKSRDGYGDGPVCGWVKPGGGKVGDVPGEETGRVSFDHPTWGSVTLVTSFEAGASEYSGTGHINVFDESGAVVWSYDTAGPDPASAIPWYQMGLNDPAVDDTGNIFVVWNPGRYDGVTVLRPTDDGFEDFDTLPDPGDYNGRFYYAAVDDTDGDGTFEIVQSNNDCNPDCAGGKVTTETFRWTGSGYERK